MTDRYFVAPPISGDRARLAGPEAHHLIHVMRAETGDQVVLFDGSGAEFMARVERLRRAEAELTILARQDVDRELRLPLTLGVALPKGDRSRWLVEKAAELGVTRLVPLVTARSVARVGGKALTRLRRTVVEASKQCGRNRLMEIGEPQAWSDFLEATQAVPVRLVAHPAERSRDTAETGRFAEGEAPTAWRGSPSVAAAVGPEGGFTQEELTQAASAGWRRVDLGPRTLRTETAAIALSAMVAMGAIGAIGEGFWGKG